MKNRRYGLSLAIIYPHPITGSLGSFRRVKEITAALSARVNIPIKIYSPYERKEKHLTDSVLIKPVPSLISMLGLSNTAYGLSKRLYYSRFLSKNMLERSVQFSKSILFSKMLKILKEDSINVIQAEHDISIPLALSLAERLRVPLVADIHNITSEELVATGILKQGDKAYSNFQNSMIQWLSGVDLVCVVSKEMKEYIKTRYKVTENKIALVPPGGRVLKNHTTKLQTNIAVFMGTVAHREHVNLFMKSIPLVLERITSAKFYATERGEDLKKVKGYCKRLRVPINWFWFEEENDLWSFLYRCKLGVLPSSNDVARILGTPIKLLDYLSAGLPVVANNIGGWSHIIEEEGVGLLTEDDPKDFAAAISTVFSDEDLFARMSSNALRAVEQKFSWEESVKPIVRFYENFA